jgi:hypothetical protein
LLAFCKFLSSSSACFFVNTSILSSILGVASLTRSEYRRSFLSHPTRWARVCFLSLSNRRRSSNFALRTPAFLRILIKESCVGTTGQNGGQDSFHIYLVGFPLPPYRRASHRLLYDHSKSSLADTYSQQCYDKPAP